MLQFCYWQFCDIYENSKCIFRIAQCLIDVRGLRSYMQTVWFACHEHFEEFLWRSFSQFFLGFILFINYLYSLGKFCSATFILYFFYENSMHSILFWLRLPDTIFNVYTNIHCHFVLPVQILKKIICQWLLKSLYVSYQLLLLHGSFAGGENFTKLNVTIY